MRTLSDSPPDRFAPTAWSTRVAMTAAASTILLGGAAGAVWRVVDGALLQ
jgi:hypothetical protein